MYLCGAWVLKLCIVHHIDLWNVTSHTDCHVQHHVFVQSSPPSVIYLLQWGTSLMLIMASYYKLPWVQQRARHIILHVYTMIVLLEYSAFILLPMP